MFSKLYNKRNKERQRCVSTCVVFAAQHQNIHCGIVSHVCWCRYCLSLQLKARHQKARQQQIKMVNIHMMFCLLLFSYTNCRLIQVSAMLSTNKITTPSVGMSSGNVLFVSNIFVFLLSTLLLYSIVCSILGNTVCCHQWCYDISICFIWCLHRQYCFTSQYWSNQVQRFG